MQYLENHSLSELLPPHDWAFCSPVIRDAEASGIPAGIGGGLAFSFYSCRQRNTKDVDLLVRPADKDKVIEILSNHGFEDYFDQAQYDRSWIYRAYREGVIFDIIWTLPNHRFEVDDDWFKRAKAAQIHGQQVKLITMEDLIRVKLYVVQRNRTDWPDIMNVIYQQAENIQWRTLICLLGNDVPLLGGLMQVYAWLEPTGAARVPKEVWGMLGMRIPDFTPVAEDRKFLLDTQNWFGPTEEIATC
jgi:hypothetical protein